MHQVIIIILCLSYMFVMDTNYVYLITGKCCQLKQILLVIALYSFLVIVEIKHCRNASSNKRY